MDQLNQSLDDIIKGSRKAGAKGKRNARKSGPINEKVGKGSAAKGKKSAVKGGGLSVKRSGIKKASGGQTAGNKAKRVIIPVNKGRKRGGYKGAPGNSQKRMSSSLPSSSRNQKSQKGQLSSKRRTAEHLSNVRITISNDRAVHQAQNTASLPQYNVYQGQSQGQAGYGPRNLAVRENGAAAYTRAASIPMRRQPSSSDYGVSRRVFGSGRQQLPVVRRTHKDYDRPGSNESYMRMDMR